ncbi:hypothetical protein [Kitasatospora aureofaciens]|uniref:hypothetical protein n=1 Tax=Kitasatospora aureofaciens TaxID=1894 RepID=UPI0038175EB5
MALRRERDAGEWTILPADGRVLRVPDWPLDGCTVREEELWGRLWSMPQSLMWERYGQQLEVALYVRRLAEAEQPESRVNLSTLVRQMADSLGLTTPGMRANRWRIAQDEIGERRQVRERAAGPTPSGSPTRARFKVVTSGSGEG